MGRGPSIPRAIERASHSSFTGFMDWADAVNANSKKDATAISRSPSRFLPLFSRFLIVGSPCLASFKTNPWDASALAKGVGHCSGNSLGLSTKWGTYFSIEPYTSADWYTIHSEQCRQFLQFGGNVSNSYRAMMRRAFGMPLFNEAAYANRKTVAMGTTIPPSPPGLCLPPGVVQTRCSKLPSNRLMFPWLARAFPVCVA